MSSGFDEATALDAVGEVGSGVFRAVVPDGWQQGKGAYGGVMVGLLLRAILASERDTTRRLRSLSADLTAPLLPGPAEVRVSVLRRGGSMSFLDARLTQGADFIARASAALASPRAVPPAAIRPSPPTHRPPWRDIPVIPIEPPLGPVFGRHFEFRSTGPLPFVGGTEPAAEGWVREKGEPRVLDEAAIAGLLDVWWPTTLAIEEVPRAMATVGYTLQLMMDPRTLPPGEPLFHRGRGVASGDNFLVEMRELWSGDALVAMNQQTFAMLS